MYVFNFCSSLNWFSAKLPTLHVIGLTGESHSAYLRGEREPWLTAEFLSTRNSSVWSSKRARYIILKMAEQVHKVNFKKRLPLGVFECSCSRRWGRDPDGQNSTWLPKRREFLLSIVMFVVWDWYFQIIDPVVALYPGTEHVLQL